MQTHHVGVTQGRLETFWAGCARDQAGLHAEGCADARHSLADVAGTHHG
jgi:hypothetical protein